MDLFRNCDAKKIAKDSTNILEEWQSKKCDLSPRMVNAVLWTANKVAEDWKAFKASYLMLPVNPESEEPADWIVAYNALDSLPMVGWAIGWYLIRNLYGAPFFKPDLHINAIVNHFFGPNDIPALSLAVRKNWTAVCSDTRFKKVHLGIADYVL